MAFNPYTYVKNIYDLKGQWENANKAGDITTRDNAANQAQQYYQQLRNNGYGTVADQLQKSNYAQSKAINDTWAKKGKTSTRDYMYSLGQSKGMSQSEIDKLIGWDNDTGEVSFGGKKIGTPDSVVDGVSYWGDTSVLDNAFNDYITRSGTVRSPELAVNQENEGLFSKYNQAYDDLTKTNPFTTAEAKAIMGKYDLAGLQARDNAVASGSASNGGNIDSYASANAMRQQSALVNQGQMAVLDAHQQKIDNIRGILSDMGVNIDRVFNQDQTAKNNEVARLSEQASVTGYTPEKWTYDNNIYLNSDGTVKDEFLTDDFDNTGGFTTIINNAKAKLATTTDATERANLEATIKYATQAKALKTFSSPKYEKYAGEVTAVAPEKTAEYDTNLKSIDSAERIAKDNNATTLSAADKEAELQKTIANINASTTLSVADKEMAIALAQLQASGGDSNALYNKMMSHFASNEKLGVFTFINDVLLGYISDGNSLDKSTLAGILGQNAQNYGITKADATLIGTFFGINPSDTSWIDKIEFSKDGKYNNKIVKGTEDFSLN